jgi:hypothetical protein
MREINRSGAGGVAAQAKTASRICLRSSFPKSCSRRLPRRVFASDRSTKAPPQNQPRPSAPSSSTPRKRRSSTSANASSRPDGRARETVAYQYQGVPLAKIQELVGYWGTSYDW